MNRLVNGIYLVLLGLMVMAICVSVRQGLDAARIRIAGEDLRHLEEALQRFHQKQGHYPDTPEGLLALLGVFILGPYPKDPWGHDYVYRLETDGPVILSYGEDGAPGGDGVNADISRKVTPPPVSPEAPHSSP
jgi:general secretion pathway protein G